MKNYRKTSFFWTSVLFLCAVSKVGAAPISWKLTDVALEDGQTLTGSFVYDADLNQYSNISILNSGSMSWSPIEHYGVLGASSSLGLFSYGVTENIGDRGLIVSWGNAGKELTNAGGIISLDTDVFALWDCIGDCSDPTVLSIFSILNSDGVYVVSGSISSVPIPSAFWLFGSGLLGLLGIVKRKTSGNYELI